MNGSSTAQRLSHLEAEKLWRAWTERNDKAARDRLILAYSPMVRYLASRKVRELPAQCELDDLVSNGLVASGQTSIGRPASAAISYPGFFDDLERVRA